MPVFSSAYHVIISRLAAPVLALCSRGLVVPRRFRCTSGKVGLAEGERAMKEEQRESENCILLPTLTSLSACEPMLQIARMIIRLAICKAATDLCADLEEPRSYVGGVPISQ